jgi:hypothetical protein
MLYFPETGDVFVEFTGDANSHTASGFEFASGVVESSIMLPLIPFEVPKKSDLPDAECWFSAKLMCMPWRCVDPLDHVQLSQEINLNRTNPNAHPDENPVCKPNIFETYCHADA